MDLVFVWKGTYVLGGCLLPLHEESPIKSSDGGDLVVKKTWGRYH